MARITFRHSEHAHRYAGHETGPRLLPIESRAETVVPRLVLAVLLVLSGALLPSVLGPVASWVNEPSGARGVQSVAPVENARGESIVVARPRAQLTPAPLPTLRPATPPGDLPPFANDVGPLSVSARRPVAEAPPAAQAPTSVRNPRLATVTSQAGGVHLRRLLSSPSDADPFVSDGTQLQLAASGAVRFGGEAWYLVRTLDGSSTGWAPAPGLTLAASPSLDSSSSVQAAASASP